MLTFLALFILSIFSSLQGDFLVHFMDIAREELMKKPEEISAEKLQSLLDIALRSTAAASDPTHEELICCVERSSLLKKLATLKDLDCACPADKLAAADVDQSMQLSITGLETFCLSNKVQWPLSLVISRKALTKYQLIFRLLFHCKHVSRQLCAAWQIQQVFRSVKILGTPILRSSILCRSMLKFVNSLLHYLTFEVLEPNWHLMHDRLQTARSIDEVSTDFLQLKLICNANAAEYITIDVNTACRSSRSMISSSKSV
jgi:gamma-tubulin complex component 2